MSRCGCTFANSTAASRSSGVDDRVAHHLAGSRHDLAVGGHPHAVSERVAQIDTAFADRPGPRVPLLHGLGHLLRRRRCGLGRGRGGVVDVDELGHDGAPCVVGVLGSGCWVVCRIWTGVRRAQATGFGASKTDASVSRQPRHPSACSVADSGVSKRVCETRTRVPSGVSEKVTSTRDSSF
jgi:hypothetical protein